MRGFLLFVVGVLLGAYAVHLHDEGRGPWPRRQWRQVENRGGSLGDSVNGRLRDWHLDSDDIKADLARTGQVFREKAAVAGGKIDDVRILTVIKAKYVLDRDLSARDISVRVNDGSVVLTGTVPSTDYIGRATALALDTDGVRDVTARLTVQP